VPGFNTLDYHFSAAVSVPLAAAVGGMAIVSFFQNPRVLGKGLWYSLVFSVIPLAISLVGSSFNGLCNPLYSLGFYVTGPLASVIFAWGLAIGFSGLTNNKKTAFTGFYAFLIASFMENAAYFYFQPTVAFYNPFLGFFPGPIYETAVRIGPAYIWFRVLTTAFAILCAYAGLYLNARKAWLRLLAGVALAGLVPVFLLLGASLGYRPRVQEVRKVLSQELRQGNITLRYSPKTDPKYAKAVLMDANARWHDLETYFQTNDHRAITVYLYPDTRTSKRLTGTAKVDVAKVWLNQVHITPYRMGDVILEHELAHCFAARFSDTFLKIPFDGLIPRMDLTEGMAVAAAFDSTPLSPHEWAAAMNASGHVTDPRSFGGFVGFATAAPTKAYIVVGSFMRFLHDTYGARAIETVYRQGNYSSLPEDTRLVVRKWLRFLARYKVPSRFVDRAGQMATASGTLHAKCLTERSRLKTDLRQAFKKGRISMAMRLAKRLYLIASTPRLHAFIVLLRMLRGDVRAATDFLDIVPSNDPDVVSIAMSIASPLINSPVDLMDLLPVRVSLSGSDWSEVFLKQCMAVEAGPFYGDVIKATYLPESYDGLLFGPCSSYAVASAMLRHGLFTRGCELLPDPADLPVHFLRFDAYMSKAWCLFAKGEYHPELLNAMHKEAIYEGERMATQNIDDYTKAEVQR